MTKKEYIRMIADHMLVLMHMASVYNNEGCTYQYIQIMNSVRSLGLLITHVTNGKIVTFSPYIVNVHNRTTGSLYLSVGKVE